MLEGKAHRSHEKVRGVGQQWQQGRQGQQEVRGGWVSPFLLGGIQGHRLGLEVATCRPFHPPSPYDSSIKGDVL